MSKLRISDVASGDKVAARLGSAPRNTHWQAVSLQEAWQAERRATSVLIRYFRLALLRARGIRQNVRDASEALRMEKEEG